MFCLYYLSNQKNLRLINCHIQYSSDYVFSILLLVKKQTHYTKRIPIADKDLRNTTFKRQ